MLQRHLFAGLALLALLCASTTFAGPAPSDDKFLDSVLDSKAPPPADEKPAGEEEVAGDNAEFTIKTTKDISTLEVGDVYKSAGCTFKVVRIVKKASDGGKFVVARASGTMEPDNKLVSVAKPKPNERKPPPVIIAEHNLLDYYIMGGVFLHPIAFLALLTILLSANSVWIYRRSQQIPASFVAKARTLLQNGQIAEFEELSLKQKGLFPYVCRAIADRFSSSTPSDIQQRAEVAAATQINRLRLPVKLLNLISAAAPLLGLLGTIVGMVIVFEAVASATGASKAAALAAGIRVKLFATATALMVAIPSLFLYFIFNSRLGGIIADCETLSEEFLHHASVLKRNGHGAAAVSAEAGTAHAPPQPRAGAATHAPVPQPKHGGHA